MKIQVFDWKGGDTLKGSRWSHGETFEGTVAEAFATAQAIYESGLNVMVKRYPSRNIGTKKNPQFEPESILIGVDTHTFQQR